MNASCIRFLLPISLFAGVSLGQAQTIITNNASAAGQASYDFGPVSISAFVGTNTTPNALINSANLTYLGVDSGTGNANAINDVDGIFGGSDQERLRLTLDSGQALTQFTWQWSRADGPLPTDGVSISGFLSDPGVSYSGGTSGTPTYAGGVVNFQITTFSGTLQTVSFADLTASDGATLEIVVADSTQGGPQLAITQFQISAVPEPTTLALLGMGLLGIVATRRRIG